MLQDYAIFKKNTSAEITNKYYKECISQVKVHIVITPMRKYARINYDFDTLNNAKQHIKDLLRCNISGKIKAYALQYAHDKQLPSKRMPNVISNMAGGFEFYIEDVEKVGNDLSSIIGDIVNSGCIEYTTMDELLSDLEPEVLDELKRVYGKELGK